MRPGDPAAAVTLAGSAAAGQDTTLDAEELHIAGVLVQCRPLDLMRVVRAVDALAAAEVFQSSAEGKLVVVIEAPSSRQVLAAIDEIRALPGVINVALVYQHAEPAAAMQQPMGMSPVQTPLPVVGRTMDIKATELTRQRPREDR
jgi:nitrate reductase NapD